VKVQINSNDVVLAYGKTYNIYRSVIRSGCIPYTKVKSRGRCHLLVDKSVSVAIISFENQGGFADLTLAQYLQMIFEHIKQHNSTDE
jgi:hypothetical protein